MCNEQHAECRLSDRSFCTSRVFSHQEFGPAKNNLITVLYDKFLIYSHVMTKRAFLNRGETRNPSPRSGSHFSVCRDVKPLPSSSKQFAEEGRMFLNVTSPLLSAHPLLSQSESRNSFDINQTPWKTTRVSADAWRP